MNKTRSLEGKTLNDTYLVGPLIGQGGMGAIFEASHLRLSRKVALKVILSGRIGNPEAMQRFQREAEGHGPARPPPHHRRVDFNQTEDGRLTS